MNCMDCKEHQVSRDPIDPFSHFGDGYAVSCKAKDFSVITRSCKGSDLRTECVAPTWCPLKKQERYTTCRICGAPMDSIVFQTCMNCTNLID